MDDLIAEIARVLDHRRFKGNNDSRGAARFIVRIVLDDMAEPPEPVILAAARAIWEVRFPNDEFEYARYLAEDTEDGGNGRYLMVRRDATAAIRAMLAARRKEIEDAT